MKVESIPYSELKLFAGILPDYACDFARVAEYYAGNPAREDDLRRGAATALARRCPREALAKALDGYNRRLGASEATLRNIARLRESNCAAVVAGQQPGLLGGPLYTIYKALTAIRLAEFLSAKTGVACVPVFWNASDGHDADEYATLLMPPGENGPTVKRLAEIPESASAFDAPVTPECLSLLEEFRGSLPETEFRDEITNGIMACYGENLAESFSRLMLRLLSGRGLIMFEPRLLRREVAGIIAREIESGGKSSGSIRDAAQRLKSAGYAPPFSGDEGIKVLIYENGRRQRVQASEGGFSTRERKYSARELLDLLEREPQKFTPDAALRPVTQDAMLPTAAYVAGPTEIAYFAQLKKVYEFFGVPMPVLYPRASVTIVDAGVAKFLGNFGLSAKDVLNGARPPEEAMSAAKDDRVKRQFAELLAEIGKHLEELRQMTLKHEPTLQKPFEKVERNVKAELEKLKDKAVAAQLNRLGIGARQWSRICDSLLPCGKMQERADTIVPWLCKYGGGMLDELFKAPPLNEFKHALAYLT